MVSSEADATHSSMNGLKCRSMTVPLCPVQRYICWGKRPVAERGWTTKGPPPPRHGKQKYFEFASIRFESGAEALHCLGFRQGLGFRVQGSGFSIQGLGFRLGWRAAARHCTVQPVPEHVQRPCTGACVRAVTYVCMERKGESAKERARARKRERARERERERESESVRERCSSAGRAGDFGRPGRSHTDPPCAPSSQRRA